MNPDDRFGTHVARSDGCWTWTSTRNHNGYGLFWDGRKQVRAHRYAWEMERGPIPEGRSVLHDCDVRNCVRVAHLRLGSQRDNMEDMDRRGRRFSPFREQVQSGERNHYARLTEAAVREIRALAADGVAQRDIAARFGIHRATVSYVVARKTWGHVV